jgi:TPR repeat protein
MKTILVFVFACMMSCAVFAAEAVNWREIWDGDKRDWWDKSIPELRELVEKKNPFATLILADKLISIDRPRALELRRQAVDYGFPQAMVWLAEAKSTSAEERLSLLNRAAELGYPRAQTEMAIVAFRRNVRPDYDKTLALLRSAVDQDNTEAFGYLAQLYSVGIGEPRSEKEKPINLFRAAYERGEESVEDDLEMRVRTGVGTEVDLLESAYLHHRGRVRRLQNYMPSPAMQRMNIRQDPLAMASLKRQSDIRHDPNRPTIEHLDALFEKAFMRQDHTALLELAKLHETGTHGKMNLPRAYAMLTMAALPKPPPKQKPWAARMQKRSNAT